MDPWALDTETFLIFPGYLAPEMVCTTWAHGVDSGLVHGRDPNLFQFVGDRLAHEHTVYANAPFDLAVFGAKWPKLIPVIFDALDDGRIHDVQTREKLLDLARGTFRFEEDEDGKIRAKGYDLASLAWRRLKWKLEKDQYRLRYHDLWDVKLKDWPQGAKDYATNDAIATLKVFEKQEQLVQYLENEAAQVRAHWALHLMSAWGIRTNQASVDRLEERVHVEIEKVRQDLVDCGLVRKDGTRDTKAAVRRMVDVMGEEAILTTKGQEMQRAEALRRAKEEGKYVSVSMDSTIMSGDKDLINYSKYSRLRNLVTGSIKDLKRGVVVPIQPRFNPLMETGRTSASGPNIQNLRRAPGVRECFVPREGNVIISCDYSQAELHTFAQFCFDQFGQSALGDALNNDKDVHSWFGANVVGIPYEEMLERLANGDDEMGTFRQIAKHANFAFLGGCSAKRFVGIAQDIGGVTLDIRDAAKLRANWLATWPEAQLFFDHVSECTDGQGWYFVKQPRAPRLRSHCTWTSACNSHFQGLCADGAKAAAYDVAKEQFCKVLTTEPDEDKPVGYRYTDLYGTRSIAFIHDEILAEAERSKAHAAAMRLKFVMEREFNKFVPDCPTTADPTLMMYWSKKAKQVWDGHKLVPWKGEAA